jgi:putative ribosome biogenesis GTPase RsgA
VKRGVVLHGTGGAWHVHGDDGEVVVAALRGKVKHGSHLKLAVGDEVMVDRDAGSGWAIVEVRPRRSQLSRREPGRTRHERTIAANVDQVVVVFASWSTRWTWPATRRRDACSARTSVSATRCT